MRKYGCVYGFYVIFSCGADISIICILNLNLNILFILKYHDVPMEQIVISVQNAVVAGYSIQRMQFQSAGGVRCLDLLVRTYTNIFNMIEP